MATDAVQAFWFTDTRQVSIKTYICRLFCAQAALPPMMFVQCSLSGAFENVLPVTCLL